MYNRGGDWNRAPDHPFRNSGRLPSPLGRRAKGPFHSRPFPPKGTGPYGGIPLPFLGGQLCHRKPPMMDLHHHHHQQHFLLQLQHHLQQQQQQQQQPVPMAVTAPVAMLPQAKQALYDPANPTTDIPLSAPSVFGAGATASEAGAQQGSPGGLLPLLKQQQQQQQQQQTWPLPQWLTSSSNQRREHQDGEEFSRARREEAANDSRCRRDRFGRDDGQEVRQRTYAPSDRRQGWPESESGRGEWRNHRGHPDSSQRSPMEERKPEESEAKSNLARRGRDLPPKKRAENMPARPSHWRGGDEDRRLDEGSMPNAKDDRRRWAQRKEASPRPVPGAAKQESSASPAPHDSDRRPNASCSERERAEDCSERANEKSNPSPQQAEDVALFGDVPTHKEADRASEPPPDATLGDVPTHKEADRAPEPPPNPPASTPASPVPASGGSPSMFGNIRFKKIKRSSPSEGDRLAPTRDEKGTSAGNKVPPATGVPNNWKKQPANQAAPKEMSSASKASKEKPSTQRSTYNTPELTKRPDIPEEPDCNEEWLVQRKMSQHNRGEGKTKPEKKRKAQDREQQEEEEERERRKKQKQKMKKGGLPSTQAGGEQNKASKRKQGNENHTKRKKRQEEREKEKEKENSSKNHVEEQKDGAENDISTPSRKKRKQEKKDSEPIPSPSPKEPDQKKEEELPGPKEPDPKKEEEEFPGPKNYIGLTLEQVLGKEENIWVCFSRKSVQLSLPLSGC